MGKGPRCSSPGGGATRLPGGRAGFQGAWGQRGCRCPWKLVNSLGQQWSLGPGGKAGWRGFGKEYLQCASQVGAPLREGGRPPEPTQRGCRPRCEALLRWPEAPATPASRPTAPARLNPTVTPGTLSVPSGPAVHLPPSTLSPPGRSDPQQHLCPHPPRGLTSALSLPESSPSSDHCACLSRPSCRALTTWVTLSHLGPWEGGAHSCHPGPEANPQSSEGSLHGPAV